MQSLFASNPPLHLRDIAAAVLSVICPGLGHMIAGQLHKGLLILSLTILTCGFGYLACVVVALDAYLVSRAARARNVDRWECFPAA